MKLSNMIVMLFFVIVYIFLSPEVSFSQKKGKISMHPSFRVLLQQYPRNEKIINPQVPRISAEVAYEWYRTNKALFFATGGMAIKANLPRAIPLEGELLERLPAILKKRKLQNLLSFFVIEMQKIGAAGLL